MKLLWGDKDGGPKSRVWCWGIECKRLGSVLLLKFGRGSREAFHTHAFNSLSWVFNGGLRERHFNGRIDEHLPRLRPVVTRRETFHKVEGLGAGTWVLTLRGPWSDHWREYLPPSRKSLTLTHGRKEVAP